MDAAIEGAALISECGVYRWHLARWWAEEGPIAMFIMLNPSTADANVDDSTIRRCIAYAMAWGCAGLTVCNLFAYRATDPRALHAAFRAGKDIVGPRNDVFLLDAAKKASIVVCGWGKSGVANSLGMSGRGCILNRDQQVLKLLQDNNIESHYLERTNDGYPKHPLYLKGDLLPKPFWGYTPPGMAATVAK